jgi:hypothetical protein
LKEWNVNKIAAFLLILVVPWTANAELSFEQKANLLAERIDYLSQFAAQKYIPLFDQQVSDCMTPMPRTPDHAGVCIDHAVAAVETAARVGEHDTYVAQRLARLRDAGYLTPYRVPTAGPTFGILGDSLAAGAVADLKLEANLITLILRAVFDIPRVVNSSMAKSGQLLQSKEFAALKKRPLMPLTRIFDTPQDHKTGWKRWGENQGSAYVDCPQCSFAYLLARDLGIAPQNIFLSAQDGTRVSSIHKQMQRLELPLQHLPDYIVISFTANDFCGEENAQVSGAQKYQEYVQEMVKQLTDSLKDFKPAPSGTHILVVASADVVNLLTNKDVLDKVISYWVPFEKLPYQVTCRDLRKETVPWTEKLAQMCPLILKTDPDDASGVAKVAELHDAVVRAQRDAATQTQQWIDANHLGAQFSIAFTDQILATKFTKDDVANECFHPSIRGHEKIALQLKATVEKWMGK